MAFPNDGKKFKPGESGNPAGKPKGARHLSTIIQELEADIDWDLTSLKSKEELSKKYGKNGMKALVMVAFSKAMSGDTRAMDWLARYGYGNKLDITTGGEKLNIALVEFVKSDGNSKDTSKIS